MTTILAVDDSATMRACLEIAFSGTDLDLVVCDGSAAALDRASAVTPALFLVDVSLPPTDGYELCDALKRAYPSVPILLLASKQHPFDFERGASVDDFVEKPFDTQGLYDKAKTLLAAGVSPAAAPKVPEFARSTMPFTPSPLAVGRTLPGFGEQAPEVDLGKTMSFVDGADVVPGGIAGAPRQGRLRPAARTQLGVVPDERFPAPALEPSSTSVDASGLEEVSAYPASSEQIVPDSVELASGRVRGNTASWEIPEEVAHLRARFTAQVTGAASAAADGPDVPSEAAPGEAPPGASLVESIAPPREITASWEVPATTTADDAAVAEGVQDAAFAGLPSDAVRSYHDGLSGLGLTAEQIQGVLALSREVVERVVWEVVPTLAETLIKEELRRLTQG